MTTRDYEICELGDVPLQSGLTLRNAQLAYKTYGRLDASRSNVIVYPTSYGAQHSDTEWLMKDTMQISRSKPDSLHRTPAGFTVLALDGYGLCEWLPARPTSAASYPISVRRVATLLHASFRRFLAVPPLRFASASPPSGCTGDFHPQTVGHVRHTNRPHGRGALARLRLNQTEHRRI